LDIIEKSSGIVAVIYSHSDSSWSLENIDYANDLPISSSDTTIQTWGFMPGNANNVNFVGSAGDPEGTIGASPPQPLL